MIVNISRGLPNYWQVFFVYVKGGGHMYCVDYIKIVGAIKSMANTFCDICVHHSVKYNDCKLHDGDNRTSVVHSNFKSNNRVRKQR